MKQELKTQKNKAGILMCFLLAVSLGTLTGCSGTKNDTAVTSAASEEIATDGVGRESFDSKNVETSADNETEAVIDKEQAAEDAGSGLGKTAAAARSDICQDDNTTFISLHFLIIPKAGCCETPCLFNFPRKQT